MGLLPTHEQKTATRSEQAHGLSQSRRQSPQGKTKQSAESDFWVCLHPLCCYLVMFPFKSQKQHKLPLMLTKTLLFSFCFSLLHSNTQRQAAPLKAPEAGCLCLLLWSGADVSEVGSHGWLGATKALVSWHYPAPQTQPSPAAVSVCTCVPAVLFVLVQM